MKKKNENKSKKKKKPYKNWECSLFKTYASFTLGLICSALYLLQTWNYLLPVLGVIWYLASIYFILVHVGIINETK